jgi:hypothetical protein
LIFAADIGATPFNLGGMGGLAGLENLGMGSGNFVELQQRMQQELLSNPDTLRRIYDNPLVQRLMNDPENMRNLITSNPQMQELMEVSQSQKSPENNKCFRHRLKLPTYCWTVAYWKFILTFGIIFKKRRKALFSSANYFKER